MENIPIYLIISYLYVLTSPQPWLAVNLFRAFFAVRVSHSIAYAILAVHPMRMISYFIGLFITLYMAVQFVVLKWSH
ncbi:hypothetical protein B566_EDAN004920 [Ephemera danica]|nr:hypothetical protein B566_EDAN004920 [Ephemera danica]